MTKTQRTILKLTIVTAALAVAGWLIAAQPIIRPEQVRPDLHPHAPQRCLAIFVICLALWFTNVIPLAATGLLAIALLSGLKVLPKAEAFGLFGNDAVFFMLGVFLLAAATISTGLSKRVTLLALHRFDRTPQRLVMGVTVSAAFLALWMPEHAVAAMMYPILIEIVTALELPRGAPYAKKLFLGLAWGAVIGGVGTFLGGARAPLALEMLHEAHPESTIPFLKWMIAALPVVVIMTALALIVLRRRIPAREQSIRPATRMLRERVRLLGPLSARERRLAVLNVATILAWIVWGHELGLGTIAIGAAVLLFILRIAKWNELQNYVNWGVLFMYGGAVALGRAVTETRAMEYLARQVIDPSLPPLAIVVLMAACAIVLTEGISNSAAVAVLLPIGYSLGDLIHVGPAMMTLAVTIPAGLAFLLPVGSPPNAISFAAGHYSIRESVAIGWPMSLAGLLVLVAVIVLWWEPVLHVQTW